MINQVNIIDVHSQDLSRALPIGHSIGSLGRINLVVGENGEGKTGFLRYLRSSLDAYLWWRIAGKGRIWKELNLIDSSFSESKKSGYRKLNTRQHGQLLKKLLMMDGRFAIGDGEIIDNTEQVLFHNDLVQRLKADYQNIVRRNVPHNLWGYIECQFSPESVVPMPCPLSVLDMDFKSNLPSDFFNRFFNRRDELVASPLYNDDIWNRRKYGHDPTDTEKKGNPGSIMQKRLDEYLNSIESRRGLNTMPAWTLGIEYDPQIYKAIAWSEEYREKVSKERYGNKTIELARVLLIDEPTIYLSYKKKYEFRKRLERLIEQDDTLQVFIATNDTSLIEHSKGYRFVNFDCKPARSQSRYDLPE